MAERGSAATARAFGTAWSGTTISRESRESLVNLRGFRPWRPPFWHSESEITRLVPQLLNEEEETLGRVGPLLVKGGRFPHEGAPFPAWVDRFLTKGESIPKRVAPFPAWGAEFPTVGAPIPKRVVRLLVEVDGTVMRRLSPRSGRQRKAWGLSPRTSTQVWIEPAKRVIAQALNARSSDAAAARYAGFDGFCCRDPGACAPGFTLTSASRTEESSILVLSQGATR